MDNVSEKNKINLYKIAIAHNDVTEALFTTRLFIKTVQDIRDPNFQPLQDAIVIAYARPFTENFLNTAFHARDLIKNGNPDEKKDLIMAVGKNFFLRDKKLEFSFKKPYDILLQPNYRTNGLPREDSNLEPFR